MKHLQYVVYVTCTHHLYVSSDQDKPPNDTVDKVYRLPTMMRVYLHGHITFLFL